MRLLCILLALLVIALWYWKWELRALWLRLGWHPRVFWALRRWLLGVMPLVLGACLFILWVRGG